MTYSVSDVEAPEASARDILADLAPLTVIGKEHVAALRASEGMLGLISFDTAAMLIGIERGRAAKCREWSDLLIETMLDFLVWGERPGGVVTDQQAAWLLAQVGEKPTPACMALLVSVLEEAHTVPAWFTSAVRDRAIEALAVTDASTPRAA